VLLSHEPVGQGHSAYLTISVLPVQRLLHALYAGLGRSLPREAICQTGCWTNSWFHNCKIIDKIEDPTEREWYIRQTVASGWSRNVLVMQIESGLYQRKGKSSINFSGTPSISSIRTRRRNS
jgi:hypothetical protein